MKNNRILRKLLIVFLFAIFLIHSHSVDAQIYINEFMADNANTIKDEAGFYDDWIELYNAGDQAVDIGGWYVSDIESQLDFYQIPTSNSASTTIQPNSYLILWADKDEEEGVLHIDLKLNSAGETFFLSKENAGIITVVDQVTYGKQYKDYSYGRYVDGETSLEYFKSATPGIANIHDMVQVVDNVVINELMASNTNSDTDEVGEFDDWIELYNSSDVAVDLGGLYLSDDINDGLYWQFATNDSEKTTIQPKGFLIVWADAQPEQGVLHTDFKLSSGGEKVGLIQIIGLDTLKINTIDYDTLQNDVSLGRDPNDIETIQIFNTPSQGAINIPNSTSLVSNIFINELMADNISTIADEKDEFDDWIELYNASNEAVDIGGLYITDDIENQLLWQIPNTRPDLTTIDAGGFLILWADGQPNQGVLHLDIKLSMMGEQVVLTQVTETETTIIDEVTFVDQVTDYSYGRTDDGVEPWNYMNIPTPNSPNGTISTIDNLYESIESKSYPNPFTTNTNISFYLDKAQNVNLSIYNINGTLVKTLISEKLNAGSHQQIWNVDTQISKGVYFYSITTENYTETQKLIVK